jgi:hypothetical protein
MASLPLLPTIRFRASHLDSALGSPLSCSVEDPFGIDDDHARYDSTLSKPPGIGSHLSISVDDRVTDLDDDHGTTVLVADDSIPSEPPGLGSRLPSSVEDLFGLDDENGINVVTIIHNSVPSEHSGLGSHLSRVADEDVFDDVNGIDDSIPSEPPGLGSCLSRSPEDLFRLDNNDEINDLIPSEPPAGFGSCLSCSADDCSTGDLYEDADGITDLTPRTAASYELDLMDILASAASAATIPNLGPPAATSHHTPAPLVSFCMLDCAMHAPPRLAPLVDDSLPPKAVIQICDNVAPTPLDLLGRAAASTLPMDIPLVSFLLVDCDVNASPISDLRAFLAYDSLASAAITQADSNVPGPSGMLSIAPPCLLNMKRNSSIISSADFQVARSAWTSFCFGQGAPSPAHHLCSRVHYPAATFPFQCR